MTRQKYQRQPEKRHQSLTMAQAQQLLATAQGSGLEALLLLALATGMRRGELLGLKWADIDCKQALLQVQRVLGFRGLNEYVESAPKTKQDRRQIELPSVVVAALLQHQSRQQKQCARAGVAWDESNYVFTDAKGHPLSPVVLIEQFLRVREAARLPRVSFHELRRSARQLRFQ